MEMVFEDGASENNIRLNYLAPEGSNPVSLDGNEVSAIAYGDRYVAEQAGDGYLIYAVSDGMLDLDQGSWLMGATAGVSGEFVVPDGYPLHYVEPFAMQNCQDSGNTFTIPPEIASEIWWIGSYAFFNTGLSGSLEFSDSLYSIGSGAFESCDQLTGISILPGEDPADSLSIGGQAFAESGLESVILPGNLTDLSSYVFYGCSDLTSVTFCSAEPPELVSASWGIPFEFGFEDNEAVTLEFPDDVDAESYIEWWKYALCGFSILSDEADMEAELYNDLLWSRGAFDPYVDEWLEEDSPVYEEDGVTYRRAYTAYCADAARYKLQQMLYEKAVMICEWLGVSEADLIPPMEEKPDITVYQDESIFEELVEVPDAGLAEDLPVADLDPKDVIEIETPDADDAEPGEDASGKDDAESGEDASGKDGAEIGEDASGKDASGKGDAETGEDATGKDDAATGDDESGKNDSDTGENASGKDDSDTGENASGKDDSEITGDASDEDASESANNASAQNCEGSKDLLTPTSYNTRG